MGWAGSGRRAASRTARCRRTTSRSSRPCRTRYTRAATNPAADRCDRPDNPWASSPDARFPHVLTTYRLTEHHTAGGMSRTLSRLAELQPALFCEISPSLRGDQRHPERRPRAHRDGPRPHRSACARHARVRPLVVQGRVLHQVALPWHFGHKGLVTGDVANDLIAMSEEPNVRIMESKALLCRVRSEARQHLEDEP